MLDKPSPDRLLEAVARFLRDEIQPVLDGALGFKTRVAANAIDLAIRENEGRAKLEAAEREGLVRLLGHDGELDALNRELCAAIRDGAITIDTPGLSAHLWQSTLQKLAIEQPSYATYRRVRAATAPTNAKGGDR
jgi:hypothetical protein